MPHAIRREVFARRSVVWVGLGILLLVGLTIAPVSTQRTPDGQAATPRAERSFVATDRADGAVILADAGSGTPALVIAPGEDGFMRGTLRGLARDRHLRGLGPEQPFRLVVWNDGRLTLDDTATGRRLDLLAFGQSQAEAFARLLPIGEKSK